MGSTSPSHTSGLDVLRGDVPNGLDLDFLHNTPTPPHFQGIRQTQKPLQTSFRWLRVSYHGIYSIPYKYVYIYKCFLICTVCLRDNLTMGIEEQLLGNGGLLKLLFDYRGGTKNKPFKISGPAVVLSLCCSPRTAYPSPDALGCGRTNLYLLGLTSHLRSISTHQWDFCVI